MFRNLPQDVKEAFTSVEYVQILEGIEKKNNLHLDQAAALSNEIYKLILGLTHPQQFIGAIKSAINISDEAAKSIAAEVNEKIFRPVKDSLMRIHKMKDVAEEEEKDSFEADIPVAPQKEEPKEYGITTSTKTAGELPPKKDSETNFAENKLTQPFSIPKKTTAPDPYRESV